MDGGEQCSTCEDERGATTQAIVEMPEDGRKEDSAKGNNGHDGTGNVIGHAVFGNHHAGGKLEKGIDGTIKEETDEGEMPEASIAQNLFEIAKVKFL